MAIIRLVLIQLAAAPRRSSIQCDTSCSLQATAFGSIRQCIGNSPRRSSLQTVDRERPVLSRTTGNRSSLVGSARTGRMALAFSDTAVVQGPSAFCCEPTPAELIRVGTRFMLPSRSRSTPWGRRPRFAACQFVAAPFSTQRAIGFINARPNDHTQLDLIDAQNERYASI
jgi:hypothetical protein